MMALTTVRVDFRAAQPGAEPNVRRKDDFGPVLFVFKCVDGGVYMYGRQ